MLNWIKNLMIARTVCKQKRKLEDNAIIGEEFCAAPWQRPRAILNFNLDNLSGERSAVRIGDFCNLNGYLYCNEKGKVSIGDYVFSNKGLTIRCDHEVRIGSYCMMGPNIRLWDTRNHPLSASERKRQAIEISQHGVNSYEAGGAPIIIEDNVWLCMDVVVLAGVRIGKGAVVGAGSVVTKDVPPMTFVAGIPAKKVGDVPE